jgi:hypothetical protein
MRRIITAIVITALAGCSTFDDTQTIRGKSGLRIECSGMFNDWEACYTRAKEECNPGAFKVIAKSSDVKEDPDDYIFGWNPAGYFTRRMLVVCH